MLVATAKEIYNTYRHLKKNTDEKPDKLKFTDKWVDGWCEEYRVSLRHPNTRFSMAQNVQKEIIIQFLKIGRNAQIVF